MSVAKEFLSGGSPVNGGLTFNESRNSIASAPLTQWICLISFVSKFVQLVSMPELSHEQANTARKSQTSILQRLSSVGQNEVAKALGVSEATVSRMKSEQAESFSVLLAVLGLKVVPSQNKCYPPEHIGHLEYFAKLGMQAAPTPLEWNEE